MAGLLTAQLDYVYFLYGIALVLLGAVSLSLRAEGPVRAPWGLLAAFAFTHGLVESLAIVGVGTGDSPALQLARTLLHVASYLLLLEFARRAQEAILGWTPGPWLHAIPVVAVSLLVAGAGVPALGAAIRLLVAVPAILWTAVLLASASREAIGGSPSTPALAWAAGSLGAYGLAAAVVSSPAPFLPATWPTAASFLSGTGVPLDLVRAGLVGITALAIWSHALTIDERVRLRRKRTRFSLLMALTILAVLALGWVFTERLGRLHEQDLARDAESVSAQIQDHLLMEMEAAEDAARVLAMIASRPPAGPPGSEALKAARDEAVDVVVGGQADRVAYLLDAEGVVVASSRRAGPDASGGRELATQGFVQDALAGYPGRHVGAGPGGSAPGFHASRPIRDASGTLTGVAVVRKDLDAESFGPRGTDTSFIVGVDGHVLLAGSLRFDGRPLWRTTAPASPPEAAPGPTPILDHAVSATDWALLDGERHVAVRRPIPGSDWSVVTLKRQSEQGVNRLLGIVITFLLCLAIVASFVVLEWQFGAESRLVDKHREAEGRAREMARRADTDALTGISNRFGFNQAFSREFSRARRHRQPLSIVLVDLDRFKEVNDRHGHPAGDRVLAGVARLLETHVRESDAVARWGGEEFAILAPMTDAAGAALLAEKIRALLEVTHLGPTGAVTASFGVTEMRPEDTLEAMLHRVDRALYRAKEAGRNRVVCAEAWVDMDEATSSVLAEAESRRPAAGKPLCTETGFAEMDAEHEALGREILALAGSVGAGDAVQLRAGLAALASSIGDHFAHENRAMSQFAYPQRVRHEEAHGIFQEDLRRFQVELETGGVTPTFRRWAGVRLPEWFRFHILAHDVGLARFLLQAGATGWTGAGRREPGDARPVRTRT